MYPQTGPPTQQMMHQGGPQMHQGQPQQPPNSNQSSQNMNSPLYPWMRSQFGEFLQFVLSNWFENLINGLDI